MFYFIKRKKSIIKYYLPIVAVFQLSNVSKIVLLSKILPFSMMTKQSENNVLEKNNPRTKGSRKHIQYCIIYMYELKYRIAPKVKAFPDLISPTK